MTVEWFVANVPFRCTEDQVREFLTQSGALVSRVRMIKEYETQRFRGFCFADVLIQGGDAEDERCRAAIFGKKLTEPPFTDDEWAEEQRSAEASGRKRKRDELDSRPVHVERSLNPRRALGESRRRDY